VGAEPEVKTSAAGKPWAALSVVVGDSDDSQWVRLVVFGDKATSLSLANGDKVYVEGSLKIESWTAKDGKERSGLKVAAWKIEKLGAIGRNKSDAKAEASPHQSTPQQRQRRPPAAVWCARAGLAAAA